MMPRFVLSIGFVFILVSTNNAGVSVRIDFESLERGADRRRLKASQLTPGVGFTPAIGSPARNYVSNFDSPRRDNLAADGKTSIDGIGASIVKIEP